MYILSRDGWVNIFMVLVLLNHGSQQKKLPKFFGQNSNDDRAYTCTSIHS